MNTKQLKQKILSLAITGRLVPQDPRDEPACELLKRIAPKATPLETEQPLPEGWCATTLSDTCTTINGLWKGKKGPFVNVGVIRNANFTKDFKLDYSKIQYLDVEQKSFAKRNLLDGDLIVEKSGGGDKTPVGRAILYEGENGIYSFSNFTMLLRIRDKAEILPKYIYYFLLAKYRSGAMFGMQTQTTGLRNLETDKYLSMPVYLPPLAEQKRIAEAVERWFAKIDQLEHDCEALSKFGKQVRKKLLTSAITGRLVPQDPSDEPASELLKRIAPKATPIQDDVPYEIPDSWAWCRMGDISNVCSARRVHKSDWRTAGIPFYRTREIGHLADFGYVDNELFIDKELYKAFSQSGVPKQGDLMITAVGTLGKVYVVQPNDVFYYKDASVLCLQNKYALCPQYLKLAIESPFFIEQYTKESRGTTVLTLTIEKLSNHLIPIPPLAEQKRIVKKLESMFAVLDNLDALTA